MTPNTPLLPILTGPRLAPPSAWGWACDVALANLPKELAPVIEWADANYRVVTNDGEFFDSSRSPWVLDPLRWADDPLISTLTFIKPIQAGGTSLGEIIIMRRILDGTGLLHYNWPTNEKAIDRFDKFTDKRLRACHAIRAVMPGNYEKGFIKFPNLTFSQQGVFTPGNLDSDTVDYVVNEEVHQWEPGMLGKARGRQTRIVFPKFISISNAGVRGDQLHQEFMQGTGQIWQALCPGCGKLHLMRTRWEDRRPELGGLRYDAEGCRRDDGTFDYNRLIPTIRYQFPCGFAMPDDLALRRQAAQGGCYTEPQNTGALLSNRSCILEAVACHEIRWLDLIMEKHQALRALKAGDDKDWSRYLRERECVFYSRDERPFEGQIVLNSATKINDTKGLEDRAYRGAYFDWQQGFKAKGQLIHYWGVIEDVRPDCNSLIVFAGLVNSESELLNLLEEYGVDPIHVLIDASKNTKAILQFCYQNGFKAVMGNASHVGTFNDHGDKVRRFYSAGKPIHAELNVVPVYEYVFGPRQANGDVLMVPDPKEPIVIMYNLGGLLANHFFIRELRTRIEANAAAENPPRQARPDEYFERIIPGDIGEEFLKQYDAWQRLDKDRKHKPGDIRSPAGESFLKIRQEDHLLQCLAYGDLFKDWCLILGDALGKLGLKPEENLNHRDTENTEKGKT